MNPFRFKIPHMLTYNTSAKTINQNRHKQKRHPLLMDAV